MKDIYIAEWGRKDGKDISFDTVEHASFDLDECVKIAQSAWDHQTKSEKSIYTMSVYRYGYDESLDDKDVVEKKGYDPDSILWDDGGWHTGHEWGV